MLARTRARNGERDRRLSPNLQPMHVKILRPVTSLACRHSARSGGALSLDLIVPPFIPHRAQLRTLHSHKPCMAATNRSSALRLFRPTELSSGLVQMIPSTTACLTVLSQLICQCLLTIHSRSFATTRSALAWTVMLPASTLIHQALTSKCKGAIIDRMHQSLRTSPVHRSVCITAATALQGTGEMIRAPVPAR